MQWFQNLRYPEYGLCEQGAIEDPYSFREADEVWAATETAKMVLGLYF